MKTTRKIAAVLIAAVLLLSAFPSALASSSHNFAGTHWYVFYIDLDDLDLSSLDNYSLAILRMMRFVPYESELQKNTRISLYIGLDLNYDGTFTVTNGYSELGEVKSSGTVSGTWICRDGVPCLFLNDGATILPATYQKGVLRIDNFGILLSFAQA